MKRIILSIAAAFSLFTANAQYFSGEKPFEHLDFGVSVGTTGLGFDLALPIYDRFHVRAGFSFIPRFDKTINFGIDGTVQYEDEEEFSDRLNEITDKISGFIDLKIEDNVDMVATPSFCNGNLLVDFYPIKNNAFRVTTGFYWGKSKIASACNAAEDMSTLLGATMYNQFYEKIENGEPLIGDDIYLDPELEMKFMEIGRLGFHVGDRVGDGTPYMMEPGERSTIEVDVFANSFKPYLGVGYGGNLSKKGNGINMEFDAGMLFWGGSPRIMAHDGTDLARDVRDVGGKVGRYVNFMKAIKVYPVLNLRIFFRMF
jgi:hypothetical protein